MPTNLNEAKINKEIQKMLGGNYSQWSKDYPDRILLNGNFTVEQLRKLVDFMSPKLIGVIRKCQ